MTAFALPTIPRPAWRRSWLISELENIGARQTFVALLEKLDPAAARKVDPRKSAALYSAVLHATLQRFPVYIDVWSEQNEESFANEYGSLVYVLHRGIPLDVLGFHPDNSTPALDLVECRLLDESPAECYSLHDGGLDKFIMTWWKPGAAHNTRPPRGRAFTGAWVGLPDLARYVDHNTGFDWLDVDFESQGYGADPRWSMDEIRSLEAMWKKAKPVWDRIYSLATFVEAEPRERLPLLDGALRGDKAILAQITHPARKGGRLADIFRKGKR